jgi:uncharacterized protein (TIGR03435 family)
MPEGRFHLQLHTDIRQEQVFILETAKSGVRFEEVQPPEKKGQAGAAIGDDGDRLKGASHSRLK